MLTSVAYMPGRAPATQQRFVSICLPHTIFTLYKKISACAPPGGQAARETDVADHSLSAFGSWPSRPP